MSLKIICVCDVCGFTASSMFRAMDETYEQFLKGLHKADWTIQMGEKGHIKQLICPFHKGMFVVPEKVGKFSRNEDRDPTYLPTYHVYLNIETQENYAITLMALAAAPNGLVTEEWIETAGRKMEDENCDSQRRTSGRNLSP